MSAEVTLHTTKPYVLIVDDDAALRRMVTMVLEDEGWDVLEAKNGAEALATMCSSPHRLVVLLDWKMPELSGEEVLEMVVASPEMTMRHAYALITANAGGIPPRLADLLFQLEAPTIAKPFSISELVRVVELQAHRISIAEVANRGSRHSAD
jgi:two-component system, response regulator, stage 0 sporulation protein F